MPAASRIARIAAATSAFALGTATLAPAASGAGEPTMAVSDLQAGMQCSARTVLRGTAISTFPMEIVDVIGSGDDARILARAYGPEIEQTGVAQGFSGSPVSCPYGGGQAIAGAIAEATGDYGNRLVLLTPIRTMLSAPVSPASTAAPAARRALAGPLTVSGVSGPVASALRRAAVRTGRDLVVAPAAPVAAAAGGAGTPLVPGSSVSVGLTSGAIGIGALGTVSYADGDRVWAFAHPFDGAGRRSLLLQSAWVHAVVPNPLMIEGATAYKLGSPLADIGTLTDDRPAGVSGLVGPLPRTFPLVVSVRNSDSGRTKATTTNVVDESVAGDPTGVLALEQAAPLGVAQAAWDALAGSPAGQSGRLCFSVRVARRSQPLRFCNRYVGGSPSAPGATFAADVTAATALLSGYHFGPLRIQSARAEMQISRSPGVAYLRRVSVSPSRPRRGSQVSVRVEALETGTGRTIVRRLSMRLPQGTRSGSRLTVTGTDPDLVVSSQLEETLNIVLDGAGSSGSGPLNLTQLAKSFSKIHRDDRARVRVAGQSRRLPLRGQSDVRLAGQVSTTVRPVGRGR